MNVTIAPIATAVSALLATSLANAAGREALRLYTPESDGSSVAASVDAHLANLSDAYLRDNLGGALTRAQNLGRLAALHVAPTATYYASEHLDNATCPPCRAIDGHRFAIPGRCDGCLRWRSVRGLSGWRTLPGYHDRHLGRRIMKVRASLRNGRRDWYRITNLAEANSATIHVYDEIGYFGVTASDFVNEVKALQVDSITLHVNSPGGEVFDGIAIYNALRNHPANVTVIVDALAASIASVIAMAGDTVIMEPTAQLMIHDGHGICVGNAADMHATADLLDKCSVTTSHPSTPPVPAPRSTHGASGCATKRGTPPRKPWTRVWLTG
jgi:ATP-dependent protease ClpP protease subunit